MTYQTFKPKNLKNDLVKTMRLQGAVDKLISNCAKGLEMKTMTSEEIKSLFQGAIAYGQISPKADAEIFAKLDNFYKTIVRESLPVYVTR